MAFRPDAGSDAHAPPVLKGHTSTRILTVKYPEKNDVKRFCRKTYTLLAWRHSTKRLSKGGHGPKISLIPRRRNIFVCWSDSTHHVHPDTFTATRALVHSNGFHHMHQSTRHDYGRFRIRYMYHYDDDDNNKFYFLVCFFVSNAGCSRIASNKRVPRNALVNGRWPFGALASYLNS